MAKLLAWLHDHISKSKFLASERLNSPIHRVMARDCTPIQRTLRIKNRSYDKSITLSDQAVAAQKKEKEFRTLHSFKKVLEHGSNVTRAIRTPAQGTDGRIRPNLNSRKLQGSNLGLGLN